MKRMVQYTLKPDRVADNESRIARVFDALERTRPPGLRYASLRLGDTPTFVHLVSYDGPERDNPLPALAEFQAFVAGIRERCEVPPVTVELRELGSYRFFDTAEGER